LSPQSAPNNERRPMAAASRERRSWYPFFTTAARLIPEGNTTSGGPARRSSVNPVRVDWRPVGCGPRWTVRRLKLVPDNKPISRWKPEIITMSEARIADASYYAFPSTRSHVVACTCRPPPCRARLICIRLLRRADARPPLLRIKVKTKDLSRTSNQRVGLYYFKTSNVM